MKKFQILPAMIFITGSLAACDSNRTDVEIPNPASKFCIEQGGKSVAVKTEEGTYRNCELPDGTVIEEWEFFRENQPESPSE